MTYSGGGACWRQGSTSFSHELGDAFQIFCCLGEGLESSDADAVGARIVTRATRATATTGREAVAVAEADVSALLANRARRRRGLGDGDRLLARAIAVALGPAGLVAFRVLYEPTRLAIRVARAGAAASLGRGLVIRDAAVLAEVEVLTPGAAFRRRRTRRPRRARRRSRRAGRAGRSRREVGGLRRDDSRGGRRGEGAQDERSTGSTNDERLEAGRLGLLREEAVFGVIGSHCAKCLRDASGA